MAMSVLCLQGDQPEHNGGSELFFYWLISQPVWEMFALFVLSSSKPLTQEDGS